MSQTSRTSRLEVRIAPEAHAAVRHAAALQGRSISDFVVAAAQEVAQRTIEEAAIIRLSIEDQERFANLLLDPLVLSPAMERARAAHRRLIRDS